jgi:hypothetical protein
MTEPFHVSLFEKVNNLTRALLSGSGLVWLITHYRPHMAELLCAILLDKHGGRFGGLTQVGSDHDALVKALEKDAIPVGIGRGLFDDHAGVGRRESAATLMYRALGFQPDSDPAMEAMLAGIAAEDAQGTADPWHVANVHKLVYDIPNDPTHIQGAKWMIRALDALYRGHQKHLDGQWRPHHHALDKVFVRWYARKIVGLNDERLQEFCAAADRWAKERGTWRTAFLVDTFSIQESHLAHRWIVRPVLDHLHGKAPESGAFNTLHVFSAMAHLAERAAPTEKAEALTAARDWLERAFEAVRWKIDHQKIAAADWASGQALRKRIRDVRVGVLPTDNPQALAVAVKGHKSTPLHVAAVISPTGQIAIRVAAVLEEHMQLLHAIAREIAVAESGRELSEEELGLLAEIYRSEKKPEGDLPGAPQWRVFNSMLLNGSLTHNSTATRLSAQELLACIERAVAAVFPA